MASRYGETVRRIRAGETIYMAWSSIPSAELSAELAIGGFPIVNLDMQHGGHDFASARAGVGAIVAAGGAAAVRVPVDAFAEISRVLDQGAEFVIVPMVNSAADARRAAAFAKYPPIGERSWGPATAMGVHAIGASTEYLAAANERTALMAMVETREALDNLDEILDVPGIDAVFVGPSDLSISLSDGAAFEPGGAGTMETAAGIAARARAAGKFAAIFCLSMHQVAAARGAGFSVIALGVERALIRKAAADAIAAASAPLER